VHVLAIIPAVGNEDFTKRGLVRCGGKTLLSRAIVELRRSLFIDRIVVISNDYAVLDHARICTAKALYSNVRFPSVRSIATQAIYEVERHVTNYIPDILLMVNWRAPLLVSHDYTGAIDCLVNGLGDCVYSASGGSKLKTGISKTNPELGVSIHNYFPGFYGCYYGDFLETKMFRNGRVVMFPVTKDRAVTIKSPETLEYADKFLQER